MRPKSIALLLLALGCGLVASIGITEVIKRHSAEPAGPVGETQGIFVASTDVALGDLLTAQMLKLEQWPKDKTPVGAIARIEDIEGRRTRTKLYAGDPIQENKLLGKGASGQGATALIPKGYRVVTVKVDLVSGGSSMILPGDRVDVMVHLVRDPGRDIQETVTETILQDIKVFAVDDVVDLEKDKNGNNRSIVAKTISLLVTPEQAAKLTMATQLGVINLVMRSLEDEEQGPNVRARPGDLFGGGTKADRGKESLTSASESDLGAKTKGFLDFLSSTKAKSQPASEPARSRQTFSMKMLKPGTVDEVQFEQDDASAEAASPLGAWKLAATSGSSSATPSTKEEPKIGAPGQDPAAPPAANPPLPKPQSKKDKKDKTPN